MLKGGVGGRGGGGGGASWHGTDTLNIWHSSASQASDYDFKVLGPGLD